MAIAKCPYCKQKPRLFKVLQKEGYEKDGFQYEHDGECDYADSIDDHQYLMDTEKEALENWNKACRR